MIINIKRIIIFGWQGFLRNKGLSLAVLFVMTISILVATSLFFFNDLSLFLISKTQEKIDISVYFKKEVPEEQILEVKKQLYSFSNEIQGVDYISKEEAFEVFNQRHTGDSVYQQALEQVGENPFLPSLNIKSSSPVFYAQISSFLADGPFAFIIEKISYFENKKLIERLYSLTSNIKIFGIFLSFVLIFLVVLITFNTVKLTIFAQKEEVSTMRLVGASNWFIRGPFLLQGFLYGLAAVFICDIFLGIAIFFLNLKLENWFLGFNFLDSLKENALVLIFGQIVFAGFLGVFSTFLAVRKYLKI